MKSLNINFFKKLSKKMINSSLKKSSILGSYQFYLLISIIFLSLNYVKIFDFLIFEFLFLFVIAIFLRLKFFKDRPKKRNYSNILEKIDASSFPSQHSARITLLVLFLINFFKFEGYFTILLSLILIIVLYSRIYLKQHYFIDVLTGFILGIIIFFISKFIFISIY